MDHQYQQPSLFEVSHTSRLTTIEQIADELGFSLGPGWPDHFGTALQAWAGANTARPIQTLSLFSGGGGLDIGFHDVGFAVQTMVEIDQRFAATLAENSGANSYFGTVDVLCGDIRTYNPSSGLEVDFIIGGPPCQTFSAAGRRAAGVQGVDDERGVLFKEYVRILTELSPKGFLFENVYGITGAQNGDAWQEIREAFQAAGYCIFYRVLDAADYGVPQHRERLFIVGTRGDEFLFPCPTHGPDSPGHQPYFAAADAIQTADATEISSDFVLGGRFGHLLAGIPPGLNYSFYTEKMGHPQPVFAWRSKFSDFLYKADPERPVRTIKAQGGQYTGPFHWDSRPFAVSEFKRLQTIPDRYQIVGGRQVAIHQIGNSVPPQLARLLALSIQQQLFDLKLPFDLPLLKHNQELGFRKRKRTLTDLYQKQARAAIQQLETNGEKRGFSARHYFAVLSDRFDWTETSASQNPEALQVRFVPTERVWRFFVSNGSAGEPYPLRIVVISAADMQWGLDVDQVELLGAALTPTIFTALWKSFEAELARLGLKTDLVQLRGYYQYKSALKCTMWLEPQLAEQDEWLVVQKVVSGIGVGTVLTAHELAQVWEIPEEQVMQQALFLRRLGYEARNENTNPQIPAGSFLIPYNFPTLTPLSVQLRKSLESR